MQIVRDTLANDGTTSVEAFKSSVDFNIEFLGYFLNGYEELKKRVVIHFPDIAEIVNGLQGDDEEVTNLAREKGMVRLLMFEFVKLLCIFL